MLTHQVGKILNTMIDIIGSIEWSRTTIIPLSAEHSFIAYDALYSWGINHLLSQASGEKLLIQYHELLICQPPSQACLIGTKKYHIPYVTVE